MKKVTNVFQLLVALFFGVALVFFLVFDSVKNGFGIQELTAGKVVIWLLIGLVVYLVAWMLQSMFTSSLNKRIKRLEGENDKLKARLYDFEQQTKVGGIKPSGAIQSPDDDDPESSGIRPRQNIK
ncbi:hypothetical protein GCM10007049_29210 [Echinicola pacifica]|uniref:Lipopolysaccharide assembly protein A domain-containing protein n=1 Tax=Echinicola pacifica TaxID=346377 RepID=A0A918Q6N7_9BACT|nr:hypothetical protein [Echinicola pacifica]GGZ34043.1 hypothetical protein GCM10007049_29210 [Echinicola pacifica]